MLKRIFLISNTLFFVSFCSNLFAQNYPIQSSLMLKGVASPFISDYVRVEDNPLMLTLVNSDASFQGGVVFKFSIKGVGITIESQQTGSTVFSVSSGSPLILSGADLSEYFLSTNLIFSGYSKAQYESKGVLPEGMYEFSFQAYNSERREVAVSNKATVLIWIQLHDPPQLVFPLTESIVESKTPQQVSFQWQGTTLTNANYILELYELKGVENDKRNANEIIRGASPVFTTTTTSNTYNYTIKDPILLEGMKYAWRVKAEVAPTNITNSSSTTKGLIKNEGYSSVFSFTYLPTCALAQIINRIPNKNGSAQINWMGEAKVYLIQYREKGQTDWYEELSTNQSITITQLRPEHIYEYRIQSRCEYNKSNFTSIDTFSIPTSKNGINLTPPKDGYPQIELDKTTYLPQGEAAPGTLIYVNHFEMKIGMAIQDNKTQLYSGTGSIYVPMLKANVAVEFHNVQFNKARRLVEGKIYARQKEAPKTKIPPIKKVPQICITYGPDGYDQEGRDKEGYDRAGYNKEGRDKDGYDKLGYNKENLDRNGKPKEIPKDPLQIGQQAGDPTNPNGTNTNNNTQTGTNGNNSTQNGTNQNTNPSSIPVSTAEDAFTLELIDYYTELLTDYLTQHPEIKKTTGPDPYSYQKEIDLPSCLANHQEDIPYIKEYLLLTKRDEAKRKELIQKMKSNDESFLALFTKAFNEKKKAGNEKKTYRELLPTEDWINLAEKTCNEIYQVAGENYVQTILSDLFSNECRRRATIEGYDWYSPLISHSFVTALFAAWIEGSLCATEKDKCQGKDYWTQYSYGIVHGLIEQLDVFTLTEMFKELAYKNAKNRMDCLLNGEELILKAQSGNQIESSIQIGLKCGMGIDITIEDIKQRYALTKNYIEKNWEDPYFRGEATVMIATLILPAGNKAISLVRKGIVPKLKKISTFSKEIQTLEALEVADGRIDDIAKVMKRTANSWDDIVVQGKKGIVEALSSQYKNIDDYLRSAEYAQKVSSDFVKYQTKGGPLDLAKYTIKHQVLTSNRMQGKIAEDIFKALEAGIKPDFGIQTSDGMRYIDNLMNGIARELKSGKITLNNEFRRQVRKDIEIILSDNRSIEKIEWHALDGIEDDALKFIRDEMNLKAVSPEDFKVVIY